MMFRKSVFLFIATISVIFAYSQVKKPSTKPKSTVHAKPAVAKAAALETVKGDNSLLFEISGHGLTQPSWLFGTMHIVCEEDAKLSENLKKVIKDSKQV